MPALSLFMFMLSLKVKNPILCCNDSGNSLLILEFFLIHPCHAMIVDFSLHEFLFVCLCYYKKKYGEKGKNVFAFLIVVTLYILLTACYFRLLCYEQNSTWYSHIITVTMMMIEMGCDNDSEAFDNGYDDDSGDAQDDYVNVDYDDNP